MKSLPRTVWLFGLASLFTDISSEMIVSLLPTYLVVTLGAPAMALGLLEGVADGVSAILKLYVGRISDGIQRRKPLVVVGYVLSTLARPMVSLATLPWHVIAVRTLDRVGKGIRTAPRDAMLGDAVEDADAARAYGLHRAMDHTGAVLGPLVASALLAIGFGSRDVFVAAWIPGIIAVLFLLAVSEPPRRLAPQTSDDSAPSSPPLPSELVLLLALCGVAAMGFAAEGFMLVRASQLGFAPAALPLLWLVMHVAKVLAAILGPKPQGHVPRATWLALAWLVIAGSVALLSVGEQRWMVVLLFIAAGLGHGAREPLEKALVGALSRSGARGSAFGAYHLVNGLGTLPGGIAVGWLWGRYSPGTGLLFAACLIVVAAVGLLLVRRRLVSPGAMTTLS